MTAITKEHREKIDKAVEYFLNNPGITYAKVSRLFNISESTIPRRLKKMGYKSSDFKNSKIQKHNKIENAFQYFLEHKEESYTSVAKKFGINRQSMYPILIKNGYDPQELNRNKYNINSYYFDNIDSEEKAY